jgi:hypothetical protein
LLTLIDVMAAGRLHGDDTTVPGLCCTEVISVAGSPFPLV